MPKAVWSWDYCRDTGHIDQHQFLVQRNAETALMSDSER